MGHLQSLKNFKIESGKDGGGWKMKTQPSYTWPHHHDSHNYKNVILPLRITKMSLWGENVGPMSGWAD